MKRKLLENVSGKEVVFQRNLISLSLVITLDGCGGVLARAVGIVSRTDKDEALKLATDVMKLLESRGVTFLLEPKLAAYSCREECSRPLSEMKTDLIVTIGGDGTILRTSLYLPKPEPPILAVDMGVRGFLTEVPPEKALTAVESYLDGDYRLEHYSKIASFIGRKRLPDALNEIFVTSRSLAKLIRLRIWKDDASVTDCRADGIVVASQVGSTGYSLSGGGPILDPELDAFVLTPICPLTFLRPMVFSAKSALTVELLRPERATVVIDGHHQVELLRENPKIRIKKSEYESAFVRFGTEFYSRLQSRLLFSREESRDDG